MQKNSNIQSGSKKSFNSKKPSRNKVPPIILPNLKSQGVSIPFYGSFPNPHKDDFSIKSEANSQYDHQKSELHKEIREEMKEENNKLDQRLKIQLNKILENEIQSLNVHLCESQQTIKSMETDLVIIQQEKFTLLEV